MEVIGGLEGIAKVQEWTQWRFGLEKAPSYKNNMKILKNEEEIFFVC